MNSQNQTPAEATHDPPTLSFSQAQGYEQIPGPLKLEELPKEARTHIWNLFYTHLRESKYTPPGIHWNPIYYVGAPWKGILLEAHGNLLNQPIDEWRNEFSSVTTQLRHSIETQKFHKVFDFIQYIMRYPKCPPDFIVRMKGIFVSCRLAYVIDGEDPRETERPPTILPAATPEEGDALLESLRTLQDAGLVGAAAHLRKASERINQGDSPGSVRESIHAVESVARTLAPEASKTLEPALESIKKHGGLHPALKKAFSNLYGYTSDEQGIRHALLDGASASVGVDEAVFMLGACASFSSYLCRKRARNANT